VTSSRETARAVLRAVDEGRIPRGGPSHAAALGLLDGLPPDYWRSWGSDTAARIRQQAAEAPCMCAETARIDVGRCPVCFGRPA
jgi:hypothetical protein